MILDLPAGSAHAHAYVHARTQAASTADGRLLYCILSFCYGGRGGADVTFAISDWTRLHAADPCIRNQGVTLRRL